MMTRKILNIYTFIESDTTYRTCWIKVHMLYRVRPTTQASYMIGSGTTKWKDEQVVQIR